MSRYYTDDFKRKIVELKQMGKKTAELVSEYKIAKSTIAMWEKQCTIVNKSDRKIEKRIILSAALNLF